MSHNGVRAEPDRRPMTLVNEKESCVCSPCHGGGRRRALIPYATSGGVWRRGVDPRAPARGAGGARRDRPRPRSKTAQRRLLVVSRVVYASSKQHLTSNAGKSRALASVRAGLLPTPLSH